MKAAVQQQSILLELQSLDNRITGLTRSLNELEKSVPGEQLSHALQEVSPEYVRVAGELEDARSELSRIEADVAMVDQRIAQDTERMNSSSSAKDIAGFEHELATLAQRKSALEDSELAVMQRIEDCEGNLESLRTQRESLTNDLSQAANQLATDKQALELARNEVFASRKALETRVGDELLALYEKQRQRYGIGAAELIGGVSGGSGMALSAHDLEGILKTDPEEVVLCPDSSCILVRRQG